MEHGYGICLDQAVTFHYHYFDMKLDMKQPKIIAFLGSVGFVMILLIISMVWGMSFLSAKYSIWYQRQAGLAELARAEGNRAIAVCEAEAAKESAKCFAEAEVIRARGVAEANKIIGDSLKGNESYLRYRWIEGLQTNQMQTIYVPTEAGLPILEAGKRSD